jgi:hypothetical protein
MSGNTLTLFSEPLNVPRETISMLLETYTMYMGPVNMSRGHVDTSAEPFNMSYY